MVGPTHNGELRFKGVDRDAGRELIYHSISIVHF